MKLFKVLFATALLGGSLARPVVAQTARIAHFSHSGSLATLADEEEADNFGTPPAHFVVDSIKLISDTSALEYGKWHGYHASNNSTVQTRVFARRKAEPGNGSMSAKAYIARHMYQQPRIKIVGYDTLPKVAAPQVGAPVLEKQKHKRKKGAALLPAITPPGPPHPGVLLGILLVIGLGGVGWVLGERPRAAPEPART